MADTRKIRIGHTDDLESKEIPVPGSEPPIWDADARLAIVGTAQPRADGAAKVTGGARYTHDQNPRGLLFGRILRSPHPHARLVSIDASRAARHPGVKAVVTFENPDVFSALGEKDEAGRAVESDEKKKGAAGDSGRRRLMYAGDEVAAVAAVSQDVAEDALELIDVRYETLPHVTDVDAAREPGAPKVFPEGNVSEPSVRRRGDVEAGFRRARVVVEGTYRTPVALHNALEPHGAVALWEGSKLTVWASTQGVFGFRDDLAKFFGIPASDVRVVSEYLGGGFGAKFGAGTTGIIAALLARDARAPVKLMLGRHEENLATGNRPDSVQHIRIGALADGTLTAIHLKSYGTPGIGSGAGVGGPAWRTYACPNVLIEEEDVRTNAGPAMPFRAPGYPQGSFALESTLDEIADRLGLDPYALRLKNYIEKPAKALREEYHLAAEAIGWSRRKKPRRAKATGGVVRGMGMGTAIWGMYGGPPADARVSIRSDGTVACVCGTQDIGSGTRTAMAMVTAEVLGLRPDAVRVVLGDTDTGMYSPASGGSVTLTAILPAVRSAAEAARTRFLEAVAPALETEAANLDLRDGEVRSRDGGRSLPFARAASGLGAAEIAGQASRAKNYPGLGIESFGAQFAEVEVDVETGRVRVLKIAAAHDAGRTINRLTAESQVNGGVLMGLSYALLEERVIDHGTGIVMNANLEDYRIAGTMETPEIVPILVDVYDPANNVGAKGLGEPPVVPTAAAIANAVSNAIGVRVRELPITPARVLDLLNGKEA